MGGKAKPTKHTAKEIAGRIAESTQNKGGGKSGLADRKGGKAVRGLPRDQAHPVARLRGWRPDTACAALAVVQGRRTRHLAGGCWVALRVDNRMRQVASTLPVAACLLAARSEDRVRR